MAKTSFRIPDETEKALAALAEQYHNGNKTAALVEAIRRYQQGADPEPSGAAFRPAIGWVQVRLVEQGGRCSRCNVVLNGTGYVQLLTGGQLEQTFFCLKCTR